MDCKEFSTLLDAYVDGSLTEMEADRMREHAAACPDCAARLALLNDARRMDEEIEVPEAFSSSWRRMIREEDTMEDRKARKFPWKTWIAAAAVLVFVLGGTALTRDSMPARTKATGASVEYGTGSQAAKSGSSVARRSNDAGEYYSMAYETPMMASAYDDYDMAVEMEEAQADTAAGGAVQEEKIIRSASFTIKTTNYDADLESLQTLAKELGGRVEYLSASGDASSGQTRSASLTLRIPSQRLDEFLAGAEGIGNVTSMTQEMQDVSDSYYDVKTRLETQQKKLERLQSMFQAAGDVSDLIEIEAAIADAQYYIDRYTSQLKTYDGKVEYATVRATVKEVRVTELKQVTLGQRIAEGFRDSLESGAAFLEDMVIFLVSALPWLITLGAVALVVRVIVKKVKKNRKEKKESK
ncbi:MAG: DUF4349 domain-containing protein [Clostridia bacterium]|nr:DUF4349 domain-containing protein [Clostridia bacterium]